MKTLQEHNKERLKAAKESHPNGIECPECKAEMWDVKPSVTLTSSPPQRKICCPACGYFCFCLA